MTGVLEDDLGVTSLLHKYGALSFWDYASAAPYVNIDVNPKIPSDSAGLCYKDAVYFSMHKFVGGVQTSGVLIAKKGFFKTEFLMVVGVAPSSMSLTLITDIFR